LTIRLFLAGLTLLVLLPASATASESFTVRGTAGDEIPIERHAAPGNSAIIWTPSRFGVQPPQGHTADQLAARGIEVWIADLQSAYFVSTNRSSVDHFRPEDIALLVDRARAQGKSRVFLMSTSLGARPVLRAARYWQQHHEGKSGLRGIILFHPELYAARPQPGHDAQYLPVVHETNLPVYILQPTLSTSSRRLPELRAALTAAGSSVYVQYLKGAVDGFHLRPAELMTPASYRARAALPDILVRAVNTLGGLAPVAHPAPAYRSAKVVRKSAPLGLQDAHLATTPPLALRDLQGHIRQLDRYRGKVVLVNFWATWCPPCVHEMPSMERLYEKLKGRPFEILAINVGESPDTVKEFIERHGYHFPVLLDPKGEAYSAWKVYVYPTTFILDRKGQVRYASVGGVLWDDPSVAGTVRKLMNTP
jgi:thiol-disulfide isomerase/thioredoxin/dienelactone hydrolase